MAKAYFSIGLPPFSALKQVRKMWTWQEIQWGKQQEIVQSADAIAYAVELLNENRKDFSELLNLAIEDGDSDNIDREIAILCHLEENETDERILFIWRKTILEWLYYNTADGNVLQEKIDLLYADFDYPKDMRCLIAYMPVQLSIHKKEWNVKESLKNYIKEYKNL